MPLHPKMDFFLTYIMPKVPEGYLPSIEEIRAKSKIVPPKESMEQVKQSVDKRIELPETEIPIRIYIPEGHGPFPVVVFFHGGGFASGSIESYDAVCRSIVKASEHLLVSVEYRLAPEHPFPAAPNDCYEAIKWVYEHVEAWNGDKTKISLAGDSAGGNLATVTALMVKDKGGPEISAQVLLYPCTDFYTVGTDSPYPSYKENGDGYFLTRSHIELFSSNYCTRTEAMHPYVSPLKAKDLSGLPPALVITAEFDPLRDEGEQYAEKLQSFGVPVQVKRFDGQIHGFFTIFSLLQSKEDIKDAYGLIGTFLRNGDQIKK